MKPQYNIFQQLFQYVFTGEILKLFNIEKVLNYIFRLYHPYIRKCIRAHFSNFVFWFFPHCSD